MQSSEVGLAMESDGRVAGIEVKAAATVTGNDFIELLVKKKRGSYNR